MPLSVNVGLSRKSSQNYNSEGCSINLTAELDQSLLTRSDELQQRIDQLYREADQALAHAPMQQSQSVTLGLQGRDHRYPCTVDLPARARSPSPCL